MPASVAKRGSLSASRSTISSARVKIADWEDCSDIRDPLNYAITREIEIYTVARWRSSCAPPRSKRRVIRVITPIIWHDSSVSGVLD